MREERHLDSAGVGACCNKALATERKTEGGASVDNPHAVVAVGFDFEFGDAREIGAAWTNAIDFQNCALYRNDGRCSSERAAIERHALH